MARERALGPLPEEHIRKLARRLIDGQLSLFVGAGLSHLAPAKDRSDRRLPLWAGLTEQVAAACNQDAEVFSGDPLELFDAIAFDQERGTLEHAVAAALDDTAFDLAPVHRTLGGLPWRTVVSTNYDGLLQRLLGEEPVVCEDDYDRRFAPEAQQPRLFQVHGTRFRPHTLTRDDYRLWEEKHPRAARHIHELLERGTLLLIGYSLSDPHLDAILAKVRQMTRGREKRLYAWMWRYPEQKIRLLDQRDKIEAVSIEREEHWEAAFQQLVAAAEGLRRQEEPRPSPVGADPFAYDREQYLRAVRTRFGAANLQGLYVWGAGYARDDVALKEVFVEPDLLRQERGSGREPGSAVPKTLRDFRRLREEFQDEPDPLGPRFAAFTLFQQEPRVVVVGAPGQGKSTLLRALLLAAAERWAADPSAQPFPVLVRLAEWERKAEAGKASLLDRVRQGLPSLGEIGSNAARAWLDGSVLWLLDGVDEVRDRYERERLREEVLAVAARRPGDRWIVSTRPAGEPSGGWAAGWTRSELPSLTDRQIERVLEAWGQVLQAKEGLTLDARGMARNLQKDPGLRTLRGNALLLTLAVLFYKARRRLPHDRWEFFEIAEQVLRDSWVYHRVRRAEEYLPGGYLPELLERLALCGMKEGIVRFSRERLEQETAALLTERGYVGAERDREVARFLRAAEELIGVLVAQSPDEFGFLHLTFQEFLAARALVHRSAEAPRYVARYWDHPDWEQVWVLYALAIQSDPDRVAELHSKILASAHPLDSVLERPRLMSLRLAGLGNAPLSEAAEQSVNWAEAASRPGDAPPWRLVYIWEALSQWERPLPSSTVTRMRETILEWLSDQDLSKRLMGAWAIGPVASDPAVQQALLDKLDGHDIKDLPFVVTALNSIVAQSVVREGLLQRLEAQNPVVREFAIWAMAPAAHEPEVRWALLKRLDDQHSGVFRATAEALGPVAYEPEVCVALLKRLNEMNPKLRSAAATALGSVALEPPVREALLQRLEDPRPEVRSKAAGSLRSVVSESAVREALLQRLDEANPEVRSAAATALGPVASEPSVRQALLQRLSDREPGVREATVRALASVVFEPFVRESLLQRLYEEKPEVRSATAEVLGSVSAENDVLPHLLALLSDRNAAVSISAIEALGSAPSEPNLRRGLLQKLQDQDSSVRAAAAWSLGSKASEPAVRQALLERLNDKEPIVQNAVSASLERGIEQEKFGLE